MTCTFVRRARGHSPQLAAPVFLPELMCGVTVSVPEQRRCIHWHRATPIRGREKNRLFHWWPQCCMPGKPEDCIELFLQREDSRFLGN
mmetsp:Transcript_138566/g.386510  ORF Transcript_138566/g.386510 Transcript_138566/m.386510 type:complete len:88 (-) Transcript_138566:475-738(-)